MTPCGPPRGDPSRREPKNVTVHLNRSTDAGTTWSLNGSPTGMTVDSFRQNMGVEYKFGDVNTLGTAVHHVTVDPANGDVYLVYGKDEAGTGVGNQIWLDRLAADSSGRLARVAGYPTRVSSASSNAALPSVAVTTDGVLGVLYDTFDGKAEDGYSLFSAHLARSRDGGKTFSDTLLEEKFRSSELPDPDEQDQRVLGDYPHIKAEGTLLYGSFAGNCQPFNGNAGPSAIDPIFFSVTPGGDGSPPSSSSSSTSSTRTPGSGGTSPISTTPTTPTTTTGTTGKPTLALGAGVPEELRRVTR